MIITLIWAMDSKGGIGWDGHLPWHYPEDLHHFKDLTLGHPILMGRNTFDSLPAGPLPGRLNLVLSHRELAGYPDGPAIRRLPSLEKLWKLSREENWKNLFAIGGGEIYRLLLPRADRLAVTRIGKSFECDRFFPDLEWADWELVSARESGDLTFQIYERRMRTRKPQSTCLFPLS